MTVAIGNKIHINATFTGTPLTNGSVTTAATGSTFIAFTVPATISGSQTVTVGDNKGNTYVLAGTAQNDTVDGVAFGLYKCENGVGGAGHTPSLSCDVHEGLRMYWFEITGAVTSSVVEQYFASNGFLGDPTSGPVTTTQAIQLIVSYFVDLAGNNVTVTPQNGFSVFANDDLVDAVMTLRVTSPGTYDPNPSFTPSGGRTGIITASFKELAATNTAVPHIPYPIYIFS